MEVPVDLRAGAVSRVKFDDEACYDHYQGAW